MQSHALNKRQVIDRRAHTLKVFISFEKVIFEPKPAKHEIFE